MEDPGDHLRLLPPPLPGEVPQEEILSPVVSEAAVISSRLIIYNQIVLLLHLDIYSIIRRVVNKGLTSEY